MANLIQFRRDTSTNWASVNPVLAQGELGLELDTSKYKIGNGTSAWNDLSYGSLSGEVGGLTLAATSDPPTPSNAVNFYAAPTAGRLLPKFVGPSGMASSLQPFLARNKIGYWAPPGNATTVPGVLGYTAFTTVGTVTSRAVAITNLFSRMRRLGLVSATTAGSLASLRVTTPQITLGDGSPYGGFYKVVRFGISDPATVAGARMFIGISTSSSAPTNVEPSTLTNSIGMGHGAADTNFKLYYGGSSAQTPIDLGANFPANTLSADVYELALFSPPNQNGILHYEISRLNTGHVATGTLGPSNGVNLPATNSLLTYMWGYRTNNTTALAVGIDIMSDYIETDY